MIHNISKPEPPIWKDLLIVVLFFTALVLFAIQAKAQTITGGKVDISCFGNNDGYIGVTAYPLSNCRFTCTNGSTIYKSKTGAFYGLTAGVWVVSAPNYNSISFTIEEPPILTLQAIQEDSVSVWLSVSGGTAIIQPYVSVWKKDGIKFNVDNYSTYETGLTNGEYIVSVEDDRGCIKYDTFTINND